MLLIPEVCEDIKSIDTLDGWNAGRSSSWEIYTQYSSKETVDEVSGHLQSQPRASLIVVAAFKIVIVGCVLVGVCDCMSVCMNPFLFLYYLTLTDENKICCAEQYTNKPLDKRKL